METFSYLPEMTKEQMRSQIEWIVDNGWNPGIEHTEPEHALDYYWYMWKLPMFGETDIDAILAELEACHEANPGNRHILLTPLPRPGPLLICLRTTPTCPTVCRKSRRMHLPVYCRMFAENSAHAGWIPGCAAQIF